MNRIDSVECEVAENQKIQGRSPPESDPRGTGESHRDGRRVGQSIGEPCTILEINASPYYYQANANTSFGYTSGRVEEESTVAPGEVSIRAPVNVSFELQ